MIDQKRGSDTCEYSAETKLEICARMRQEVPFASQSVVLEESADLQWLVSFASEMDAGRTVTVESQGRKFRQMH